MERGREKGKKAREEVTTNMRNGVFCKGAFLPSLSSQSLLSLVRRMHISPCTLLYQKNKKREIREKIVVKTNDRAEELFPWCTVDISAVYARVGRSEFSLARRKKGRLSRGNRV